MEQKDNQEQGFKKKGISDNALFVIITILTCWLIFFVYIGLQGRLG